MTEQAKHTAEQVALFVIEQKAAVHAQHPGLSEDHIKDEVMMRLGREVLASRARMIQGPNTTRELDGSARAVADRVKHRLEQARAQKYARYLFELDDIETLLDRLRARWRDENPEEVAAIAHAAGLSSPEQSAAAHPDPLTSRASVEPRRGGTNQSPKDQPA
jgi:hypothetical protein